MKNTRLLLLFIVLALFGCQEAYEAPKSKTVAMHGRWWAELFYDADENGIPTEDEIIVSYHDYGTYALVTTNTNSDAADSIIISDFHAPSFGRWPFNLKIPVDLANLTFKNATVDNLAAGMDGESATIHEGKILKGAGTLPSGRKADSIFMRIEFSDDPGSFYMYSGHRDTGQPEDQH